MGRKLFVEIGNAAHLMPDGEGAVYCILDYDGQRHRTEVMKPREGWNSPIWFPVTDPHSMDAHVLDITVYSSSSSSRSSYLGRVRIRGSSFSRESGGPLVYYKLKRKGFFSSVKGEIGLRVWWTGEPDPEPEAPPPQPAPVTVTVPPAESSAREVPAEHAREVESEPLPRPATPVIPPAARPVTPPAARPATPPAARPATPPATPPAARPVTPPAVTVTVPPAAPAVKPASPVPRHVAASTSAAGEADDVCSCIYSCSSSCSCSSSSDSDHEHDEEDGEWSAYDCDEH